MVAAQVTAQEDVGAGFRAAVAVGAGVVSGDGKFGACSAAGDRDGWAAEVVRLNGLNGLMQRHTRRFVRWLAALSVASIRSC